MITDKETNIENTTLELLFLYKTCGIFVPTLYNVYKKFWQDVNAHSFYGQLIYL